MLRNQETVIKSEQKANPHRRGVASLVFPLGALLSSTLVANTAEASSTAVDHAGKVAPYSNQYCVQFEVKVAKQIQGIFEKAKNNPQDVVTSTVTDTRSPNTKYYTISVKEPVSNGYYFGQVESQGPNLASAMKYNANNVMSIGIFAEQPTQPLGYVFSTAEYQFETNEGAFDGRAEYINKPKTAVVYYEVPPANNSGVNGSVIPKKYINIDNSTDKHFVYFSVPMSKTAGAVADTFVGTEKTIQSADRHEPVSFANNAPPESILNYR